MFPDKQEGLKYTKREGDPPGPLYGTHDLPVTEVRSFVKEKERVYS